MTSYNHSIQYHSWVYITHYHTIFQYDSWLYIFCLTNKHFIEASASLRRLYKSPYNPQDVFRFHVLRLRQSLLTWRFQVARVGTSSTRYVERNSVFAGYGLELSRLTDLPSGKHTTRRRLARERRRCFSSSSEDGSRKR